MLTKLIAKYYDIFRSDNETCSRKDYWIFVILCTFISILLLTTSTILFEFNFPNIFQFFIFILYIIELISLLILTIKRLHDVNVSGFWIIIPIVSFVLCMSPSVNERNKYRGIENIEKEQNDTDTEKLISILEKDN